MWTGERTEGEGNCGEAEAMSVDWRGRTEGVGGKLFISHIILLLSCGVRECFNRQELFMEHVV